jgi:hypothetical protein
MKTVKKHLQETNPSRVEVFEKAAAPFVKKVLGDFSNWQFYTGESMNVEGMVGELRRSSAGIFFFVSWKGCRWLECFYLRQRKDESKLGFFF